MAAAALVAPAAQRRVRHRRRLGDARRAPTPARTRLHDLASAIDRARAPTSRTSRSTCRRAWSATRWRPRPAPRAAQRGHLSGGQQVGTTHRRRRVRRPRPADPADGQRQRLQRRPAAGRAGPVRDRARGHRPAGPAASCRRSSCSPAASLRPSDFGLDTVLKDLPNTATSGRSTRRSHRLDLDPRSARPATRRRASSATRPRAATHTVGFDATAYDDQTASGQTTFTTDNCARAALHARAQRAGSSCRRARTRPVELSTTIAQTIDEAGLKRAQVTLPNDLGGNNAALATTCPQADFQAGTCPANTIVGSAVGERRRCSRQTAHRPGRAGHPARPRPAAPRPRPARARWRSS